MSDEVKAEIISLVSTNGRVLNLIDKGYAYSQISLLIKELQVDGFLCSSDDGRIMITQKGEVFLKEYVKKANLRGANQWIWPQAKYARNRMDRWEIYFPPKL